MTVSDDTGTPLWAVGGGRPRPRQVPARCALCQDPPASVFGLCTSHLAAAAIEAARLLPPPTSPGDGRLSSVSFSELYRRCGRPGHDASRCDA
jgi:hypothetical protein